MIWIALLLSSDVKRYALVAELNNDATLAGDVKVEFSGSPLVLSANGMTIRRVMCGGRAVHYTYTSDALVIDTEDATQCSIAYIARPGPGLMVTDRAVYTIFNTWRWMLLSEDISDRARFDLTLTVPKGYDAFATGTRTSICMLNDGRVESTFIADASFPYICSASPRVNSRRFPSTPR